MTDASILITTASACAAVLTIAAFVRWVLPRLRKIGHIIDDIAGEPARPGVEARPGLMERVSAIEESTRGDIAQRLADTATRLDEIASRADDLDRGQLTILSRQDEADAAARSLAESVHEHEQAVEAATRDRARLWDVIATAQRSTPPDAATS